MLSAGYPTLEDGIAGYTFELLDLPGRIEYEVGVDPVAGVPVIYLDV